MGICKCRKRTDLWCFVHSKPVCASSCIIEHKSCYVGPYIQWLSDAYYDKPRCALCKQELTEDYCVRLLCQDAFHMDCLNSYCANFPSHTAIAGYTCPTCAKPIIPIGEEPTPIVASVKDYLRTAPWVEKLGGLETIESAASSGVVLTIQGGVGLGAIPVTDIISSNSRKTGRSSNPLDNTGDDDEEEDKYSKRPLSELFTNVGGLVSQKSEGGASGGGARSRRPLISTRRILVLFALVSTLATAIILYLSLSISPEVE